MIWYTKYSENMLGFVDPATGQGKEWAMPRPDSGPHRMHIDNDDNLWIPLSGYGTILRYNTRTGARSEFTLPDADSFPYVARFDAKSNRVWIAGNGGNAIYALDPKTGKSTTFRLPSLLSYGRMISIDYSTGERADRVIELSEQARAAQPRPAVAHPSRPRSGPLICGGLMFRSQGRLSRSSRLGGLGWRSGNSLAMNIFRKCRSGRSRSFRSS